jgi:hypothetical protein
MTPEAKLLSFRKEPQKQAVVPMTPKSFGLLNKSSFLGKKKKG